MDALGVADHSISATGTAQTVLGHSGGRKYLFLQNLHATANVYFTVTGVTAVVGAAGTIKLFAGDSITYENVFVPASSLSVIADAAAVPVTILEG